MRVLQVLENRILLSGKVIMIYQHLRKRVQDARC